MLLTTINKKKTKKHLDFVMGFKFGVELGGGAETIKIVFSNSSRMIVTKNKNKVNLEP